MPKAYNVLFLCPDNGSRSIFAEALLNHKGRDRFRAYSAAEKPASAPRQEIFAELKAAGISTEGLTCTHRDTFSQGHGAPDLDFVFVLCDTSGGEVCPGMPDHPITARWDIPDPVSAKGGTDEVKRAFHEVFTLLDRRINLLLALQDSELERMAIEQKGRDLKAA
jgi:arsenate reductase